jgi:TPR repeat protein
MDTNLALIEETNDMIATEMRQEAEEQLKKLHPLAEQGDPDAQNALGDLYSDSSPSTFPDDLLAWDWYYKSAEQGHPHATAALILMWRVGSHKYPQGLPWTDVEGILQSSIITLTSLAEENDDLAAIRYLGWFKTLGIGCDVDFRAATQYLHKGANLGCPECMAGLGIISMANDYPLNEGLFSPVEWLEQSWDQYCFMAGVWLGRRYLNNGHGDQRKENNRKAISYFQAGADLGCGDAAKELAECYALGVGVARSEQAAYHWYKVAAGRNNDDALYILARSDYYLPSIEVSDQRCTEWMEQAAKLGNLSAMGEFGYQLIFTDGAARDVERGLELVRRSARSGDATSFHILGNLYRDGEHLPQSYEASTDYYRRSAEEGSARGHLSYGYALLWGEGVERNPHLASKHFSQAFDVGIFAAAIGLGMADYQLSCDPVRSLGFVLCGLRENGGTPPDWISEFIERLTERLDEEGLALAEEFSAHLRCRFNN